MARRPGAVPITPSNDREQELSCAEQEAVGLENQLPPAIAHVESQARQVVDRLQQLKAEASQLQLLGSLDPAFAEVQQRMQQIAIPILEVSHHRERAFTARIQAVNARLDAADAIRRTVDSFTSELTNLSAQLSSDETTLHQCRQRIQEESTRRAAEEEQRRAAAAEAPQPPIPMRPASPGPASRGKPRVRMQVAIDFESDSNFYTGFSTNISEGGIFVATVNAPPQGALVDLHFSLPGGARVDARGEVRWSREVNDHTPEIFPGVGVQFLELPEGAGEAIKQFVTQREPMFFPD